jgi:transcriptional regulator with XRE-family HTH domain
VITVTVFPDTGAIFIITPRKYQHAPKRPLCFKRWFHQRERRVFGKLAASFKTEAVSMQGAKRARIEAGFTLQAAAKELTVCAATVWRWEAGAQTPSIDKIKELAELYGCNPRRLMKPPKPTRYETRKAETAEGDGKKAAEVQLKISPDSPKDSALSHTGGHEGIVNLSNAD